MQSESSTLNIKVFKQVDCEFQVLPPIPVTVSCTNGKDLHRRLKPLAASHEGLGFATGAGTL